MLNAKISPSMMCVNSWGDPKADLAALERAGTEYLHIDIMDGHFVPNITLGFDYIKALRKQTRIPLDIHLMVEKPENMLPWLDIQPGEIIAVHTESTLHLQRVLAQIRALGGKPFVALNPATPLCMIEHVLEDIDGVLVMTVNPGFAGQKLVPQTLGKIRKLRNWLDESGFTATEIAVDGNVSMENALKMRAAGANIFVGGTSSIFSKAGTIEENSAEMRNQIKKGETEL